MCPFMFTTGGRIRAFLVGLCQDLLSISSLVFFLNKLRYNSYTMQFTHMYTTVYNVVACDCHHDPFQSTLISLRRSPAPAFPSPARGNCQSVCLLSLYIHLLWTFHVRGIIQYAVMSGFFHSHSIFKVRQHSRMSQYFIPFCSQLIFHCIGAPPFIYPLIN